MLFEYTRRRSVRSPVTDAATFKVGCIRQSATSDAPTLDLSHLIDCSYNYHSPRELRWHLAERLGLAPAALALRESARAWRLRAGPSETGPGLPYGAFARLPTAVPG